MPTGQLASSLGTIEPKSSGQHPISVLLFNGDTGNDTVVLSLLSGSGADSGNARTILQFVLGTGESCLITGISLGPNDVLQGSATNGAVVNYVIFPLPPNWVGACFVQAYDSNGALKQKSVATTGLGTGANRKNTAISTAGAGTLTAAALVGGVITRTGPNAAYSDTTDTAALIIAGLANATIGNSWTVEIKNTTAFAETIVGGASVTLSGQTIIPPNSVGTFLMTFNGATTVTMQGIQMAPMTTEPLEVNTTLTTNGAGIPLAAGIVGGVITRSGATSAFSDTTDTGTAINSALPNANIGTSWEFTYVNTVAFVGTLIGGAGVTITCASGALLVAPNSWMRFLCTLTAANTVTMVEIASGPNTVLPPAKFSTINVTTGTLAVGNASGAAFTSLFSTNATPGSQAMRTPAQILADTPGLLIGQSYIFRVTNSGAGAFTLATDSGAGFTMTGTMTIAQNTFRDFVVTINTATTGTVQQIGTGTSS